MQCLSVDQMGVKGEFATLCFVVSWIIGSLGHPRARERERETVHSSKSHLHITNPGLLQRVDILGDARGWRGCGRWTHATLCSWFSKAGSRWAEPHLIPLEPLVSRPCNPQHTAHYWTVAMVTAVSSIDLDSCRVPTCYASSRSGCADCNTKESLH